MTARRPWRYVRRWGSLGNIIEADCTVAAYYHLLMAQAVLSGSTFRRIIYRIGFRVPGTAFALREYTLYLATLGEKPSAKQGVNVTDWLDWQKSRGNVIDWIQIRPRPTPPLLLEEPALRSALDDFDGVMLAGCLTPFSFNRERRLWYLRPGDQPSTDHGHTIAYLDNTPTRDLGVTWGHWQYMTIPYREACFAGAFVFVAEGDPHAVEKLAKIQSMRTP